MQGSCINQTGNQILNHVRNTASTRVQDQAAVRVTLEAGMSPKQCSVAIMC